MINKLRIVNWRYLLVFSLSLIVISVYISTACNDGGSSLEDAWNRLMLAMKNGDMEQIQKLTTDQGLASIIFEDDLNENLIRWQRWGKYNIDVEVRWDVIDRKKAEAWVGPKEREGAFIFVKTFCGWKLDEVLYGA